MAKRAAKSKPTHKWEFRARFRRNGFGWRSQLPVKRVKQAVTEIKKVARKDELLAAEGAVLFLEKVSPAIEQVDSSSGSMGTAVNNAVRALARIIGQAPADAKTRQTWLERVWEAQQDDEMPYLEHLGDVWGDLCASKEVASDWAGRLLGMCTLAWSPDPDLRGYFKGTSNCLSALLAAERYTELLELLDMDRGSGSLYARYGVKALSAQGKKADALRYAQGEPGRPGASAHLCEEVLLSSGLVDEAYRRYGLQANRTSSYLSWFRAVAKKYPHKQPGEILQDLVDHTPGQPGKWFAAAKSAKLFDEAIALANRSPCAPQTLARAARDFAETEPTFALEAGLAALHWLAQGHGYEVTRFDVSCAYSHTLEAAKNADCTEATLERIRTLAANETSSNRIVNTVIGHHLGPS